MSRYHIKKDGTPGVCNATQGNCPLGGTNQHYNSIEDAQSAIDKQGVSMLTVDYDSQESEIKAKIAEAKGIKKIHLKQDLKRVQYARDGRDYDKERADKLSTINEELDKAKQARIDNQQNANKLYEMKTIPRVEMLNGYNESKYSANKITAYRGEVNQSSSDEVATNSGTAIYGGGRYTSTNKKYSQKFGNVRTVDREELPDNPIRFNNQESFDLWTQKLASEHGTQSSNLFNNHNIGDLIKKMGYDGLTVGTSQDMILVKY